MHLSTNVVNTGKGSLSLISVIEGQKESGKDLYCQDQPQESAEVPTQSEVLSCRVENQQTTKEVSCTHISGLLNCFNVVFLYKLAEESTKKTKNRTMLSREKKQNNKNYGDNSVQPRNPGRVKSSSKQSQKQVPYK